MSATTETLGVPARRRDSIKTTPKVIALTYFVSMAAAAWSTSITCFDYVYFTLLSLQYLATTFVGLADIASRTPIWTFWLQNVDVIAMITSLPLIATQLCILSGTPYKFALCNLIPAVLDLVLMAFPVTHMQPLSDKTLAIHIFIIIYCAHIMKSKAAAVLAIIYSFLYYGPDDPEHSVLGPTMCVSMFLMGTIAISNKESLKIA